ncbi:MAG TPA: hypothetical protein VIG80_12930, partial [Bacillaceae bacterium]
MALQQEWNYLCGHLAREKFCKKNGNYIERFKGLCASSRGLVAQFEGLCASSRGLCAKFEGL